MIIERLSRLCLLNGVSGFEDDVREYIISEIKNFVNKIVVDNMGNIIAFKSGASTTTKKIMLAAHMDEVGLIVRDITKDGYIKFSAIGGIDERVLIGKNVYIGKNKTAGVIGATPVHILTKEQKEGVIKQENLYIDIGADSREDADKYVNLGDFIAFDGSFEKLGSNIKCKAIDDRFGCEILIDLLKNPLPIDVVCVFTVKEEVGCLGAKVAANIVKPDIAIIIETTTSADLPGNENEKKVCSLGEGVVIPFMDSRTIYDKELYNMATNIANINGIKWQTKTVIAGGNDAGVIQTSYNGVRVLALSIPSRYLHSQSCVISLDDIQSTENLINKLLMEYILISNKTIE